jgi:hypothetical protein
MDLFWNVSTWNPYAVILMRSRIEAGPAATPATCRTRRRGWRMSLTPAGAAAPCPTASAAAWPRRGSRPAP